MDNNLLNSAFKKKLKFEQSFNINVLKIDEWLILKSQFKEVIGNYDHTNNKLSSIQKNIHKIFSREHKSQKFLKNRLLGNIFKKSREILKFN